MAHLSDIISALEQLAADVEIKSRENPNDVEQTLEKAFTRTSDLICHAIPEKEQRSEWLSELSTIGDSRQSQSSRTSVPTTHDVTNKTSQSSDSEQCTCPVELKQIPDSVAVQPSPNFVQCIHGCNSFYCSAACRKHHMREHRSKCHALKRKEVLRKIGLNSSEELF